MTGWQLIGRWWWMVQRVREETENVNECVLDDVRKLELKKCPDRANWRGSIY
jgi:hypothetical protein